MPQIYPDEGLIQSLLNVVDNNGAGLVWALWVNDVEPDLDSELLDFTPADSMWGQVRLKAVDFPNQMVNVHVGVIQATPIRFQNTGATSVDVYGYMAYDDVDDLLILVNRYVDAPIVLAAGGKLDLVPIVGDSSLVLTDVIDGGTF